MDLQSFFLENLKGNETEKVFISNRFLGKDQKPIPFEIKAITEEENTQIKNACKKRIKQKYGQTTTETDQDLYQAKLIVACTVFPDFKNADLIQSWKPMGVFTPEELVRKMLRPGEFTELLLKIQAINGFDEDVEEVKEEIKKQ